MNTSLPNPPNHESYKLHQRQVALQILLPLVLFLLILIAVGTLMTSGGGDQTQPWAAISTIWLIIPALIFGLLILALLVILIVLMIRLLRLLPSYSAIAQKYINKIPQWTHKYADKAVAPLIWIKSKSAMVSKFTKR